jgi:hypothetical protein
VERGKLINAEMREKKARKMSGYFPFNEIFYQQVRFKHIHLSSVQTNLATIWLLCTLLKAQGMKKSFSAQLI